MRTILMLALLILINLAVTPTVVAGNVKHSDFQKVMSHSATRQAPVRLAQGNGMSLSEAIAMVKRQYKGRIVGAETVVKGNREEHRIRVLTEDGKVRTVRVPGRVLSRGRA